MNSPNNGVIAHTREQALAMIRNTSVIPVIRTACRDHVFCGVEGTVRGGIAIAEVTLTIPGALRIIEELADRYGEKLLVGAGTVLDAETCRAALLAGAEFIVSPHLNVRVIEMARRYSKVCIAGALTPTEVVSAWQAGADLVKIFPCGAVGGAKYIRTLKGPFPQIDFLPTGGIDVRNAAEFIAAGATAVGVGEQIFDPSALRQGNVELISQNAQRFIEAIRLGRGPKKIEEQAR